MMHDSNMIPFDRRFVVAIIRGHPEISRSSAIQPSMVAAKLDMQKQLNSCNSCVARRRKWLGVKKGLTLRRGSANCIRTQQSQVNDAGALEAQAVFTSTFLADTWLAALSFI
jgi:hypothetical protein